MPEIALPSFWYQCNSCECLFLTRHDLERHKTVCGVETVNWRKGNYGSDWCFASESPKLASSVRANGKLSMGGFDITLDPSGKYLRKQITPL